MEPDELLSASPLDWEEAKTLLIVAVGIWITAVVVLDTDPLVASGVVAAFVAFIGSFLLGDNEI
jgi:hypothetical protein